VLSSSVDIEMAQPEDTSSPGAWIFCVKAEAVEASVSKQTLTSPGLLLIVAVLAAGGIFLLDAFYLSPHLNRLQEGALREQAGKAAAGGRLAILAEQRELGALGAGWAHDMRSIGDACKEDFADFAASRLPSRGVQAAWVSDPSGRVVESWCVFPRERIHRDERPWSMVLGEAGEDLTRLSGECRTGLAEIGSGLVVMARQDLPDGGALWLARALEADLLSRIGETIGGGMVVVPAGQVPRGALEDDSATHAFWPTSNDILAVAWPACSASGRTLGHFRADLPVVSIRRQASSARRMVWIVLMLSEALVLLVIVGAQMLVAGPVARLLNRLALIESGQTDIKDLTHQLHGEPLILARRLESAFDRLAHMSKTDPLTGLANRRHFEEVLDCFYEQARRYNRPLSLITMDIDFFKAINDTGGHQVGDELLKSFAETVEAACRKADLPARFGGDEFAVLLPETTVADAAAMGERIRKAVAEKPFRVNAVDVHVTTSVGLVDLNSGEIHTPEAMVALADRALYAAKEGGRNLVVRAEELDGVDWDNHNEGGKAGKLCKTLAGLDTQFKGLFLQAIEEIMDILEQRDPYMGDHARKVQHYSVLLAREMELPERVVKRIEIAAMLHDIGMLAMPDAVLLSEHELTDEQLGIMRKHPLYGVRIMEGMEFLEQEIPAVRYHHERFDGTGYPEGLVGAAIPLTARILAVADVFDAMTSPRTFRTAKTRLEALSELSQVAGTQFDPAVIAAFLSLAERVGDELMRIPEEGDQERAGTAPADETPDEAPTPAASPAS
jgi:diguanylate cyclase (GGDEF)-like protein